MEKKTRKNKYIMYSMTQSYVVLRIGHQLMQMMKHLIMEKTNSWFLLGLKFGYFIGKMI